MFKNKDSLVYYNRTISGMQLVAKSMYARCRGLSKQWLKNEMTASQGLNVVSHPKLVKGYERHLHH